jgi:hypothetical protein
VNKKHLYIVLFLLSLPVYCAFAQNDCEVPSPPELTYVTVLPETSTTLLNWTLSQSSGIAAYIVYIYETRLGNPGFFAIDTSGILQQLAIQTQEFNIKVSSIELQHSGRQYVPVSFQIF